MAETIEVTAIEKVSAPAYLHALFAAWRDGRVAMPVDTLAQTVPGVRVAARVAVAAGGGWFDERLDRDDSPAPAQISLTSGTTGTPKPILLSRRALSDATTRLIEVMRMDASIREYIGVPVTFSFGLGRARAIAAVGGASYLPERGFRADQLAQMLAAGEINALSAVPTLVRVLLQQSALFAGIGDRLRWLEIGSQAMAADEKAAVAALFPKARIVQHYGLTEASRTTFLAIDEGRALDSVGRASGGAEARIDGDGHICVRGPHLADGVLSEHGIAPLAGDDGWLRTNDLGAIDADGFLHYSGRADDLLNIGGIKVPAELFEQRLAARIGDDAARIAIAARHDPLRGEAVMVAHLAGAAAGLRDHARAVGASFGLGAADVGLVEVAEIPRTATGKIRRGALTERYGQAGAPDVLPAAIVADVVVPDAADDDGAPRTDREREIAAIWHQALGVSPIGRDESFFDIGGDSLSAITVMLRMERAGIPQAVTQQIFEGRTIAEIAASSGEADAICGAPGRASAAPRAMRAVTTDAISMTRAILVMLVIASHWSPFLFQRMGALGANGYHYLVPLFRAGTPGFAIVFGLGLGYFQAPVARRHPQRLRSWRRARVVIIGGSIALLGVLRGLDAYLLHGTLGAQWPTTLFFGVLCFYLLMVLTAPWWLALISRAPYPIVAALLTMILGYLLSIAFRGLWLDSDAQGLPNLARLMLVTRYSYPEMLGHAMLGLAIGLWIGQNDGRPDLARAARWAGAAVMSGGILLSLGNTQSHWFDDVAALPTVLCYAGGALLLFSFAFPLAQRPRHGAIVGQGMRLLIVIGLLALPAYVGHEGVKPAAGVLRGLGLAPAAAIAIPTGLFLLGFGIAMRRVYRLYYGGQRPAG